MSKEIAEIQFMRCKILNVIKDDAIRSFYYQAEECDTISVTGVIHSRSVIAAATNTYGGTTHCRLVNAKTVPGSVPFLSEQIAYTKSLKMQTSRRVVVTESQVRSKLSADSKGQSCSNTLNKSLRILIGRYRLIFAMLISSVLCAVTPDSAQAQKCWGGENPDGSVIEGCNPTSRHPFAAFNITSSQGVFGGAPDGYDKGVSVADALTKDLVNTNNYWHSQSNCTQFNTINSEIAVGSAPLAQTGGSWRRIYAIESITTMAGCYNNPGGTSTQTVGPIIGFCADSLNINNARTGSDDACYCPVSMDWQSNIGACVAYKDVYLNYNPPSCPIGPSPPTFGKPILPLTGVEEEVVSTRMSIGSIPLFFTYSSSRTPALAPDEATLPNAPDLSGMGKSWLINSHKQIVFDSNFLTAHAARGDGRIETFLGNRSGYYLPPTSSVDQLWPVGVGETYRFIDGIQNNEESYSLQGQLQRIDGASGGTLTYTYSDTSTATSVAPVPGYLIGIQDNFGRTLHFVYTVPLGANASTDALISQVSDSAGHSLSLSYDVNKNLGSIFWPDGTVRQFLYENPALPGAMTGEVDENNSRYFTIGYDPSGRATNSALAGNVDQYMISYSDAPQVYSYEVYDSINAIIWRYHAWQVPTGTLVTTPNGSHISLSALGILGYPRMIAKTQPAGSGCSASANTIEYDANGNASSVVDFNGALVCSAHDPARNLELTRVEGLSNTASCTGLTTAGATLPSGARIINTIWHPLWRLEAQRAEPAKLTTSIYNGQPDPFNGGATASCAPATATLPDGQPIAVLCKRVEQATTDPDGHLGFAAGLDTTVAKRVQTWTYNQYGQVLTATDPLNNTTTSTYYPATTGSATMGDLWTVTDAAGHTTTFNQYDPSGQVLQSTDANGVVTVNTYDARERLLSTTVGGQTTSYGYDAVGQLKTVTLPNQAVISYTYDAAHRLKQVVDGAGNTVTYTLDNAGNRIGEQVQDASGTLLATITRTFDALNRVQSISGATQ